MSHVMLDLETMGTRPGSVILSIGAKFFSPTGPSVLDRAEPFYQNVERQSCLDCLLTEDESTAQWWAQDNKKEAWAQLQNDQVRIEHALRDFVSWYRRNNGQYIWSQGAVFDVVLVEEAMRRLPDPMTPPWKFWDIRDTRTVYDAAGLNPRSIRREGTYHNALDDCIHQITCVHASYARLGGRMV